MRPKLWRVWCLFGHDWRRRRPPLDAQLSSGWATYQCYRCAKNRMEYLLTLPDAPGETP